MQYLDLILVGIVVVSTGPVLVRGLVVRRRSSRSRAADAVTPVP